MERRKSILTARKDLQHNVDWIEEVIRRFSEAFANKQSFYSVNMRRPLCIRAVSINSVCMNQSNQSQFKDGTEKRYRDKDWSEIEETIFDESVKKHHSELRHVRSDLKTRTMPEIVRYFGHWKSYVCSPFNCLDVRISLYGREQLRRLRFQPTQEVEPTPVVIIDDNTSIYQKNDRRTYTCAVCRTRESESWWKAPRNLPTNSMCDDCGILWRKYAIKSAKGTDKEKEYLARIQPTNNSTPDPPSTRSGAAANKVQAVEKSKREGTPLLAPVSKKTKVCRART